MQTDHDTIGWGILATGHIASVFAGDLALLPDEARLVAVGSRSAERAEAFATEHGFARAYGSHEELAADPEVDIVYVATTHNAHLDAARLLIEAGKAVLVEKPLTTSAADTESLIELARARGVFLMEAMWTRTNPLIRQAAELVAAGEIGEIRHLAADFGFAFRGPATHRLLDPAQAGGAIWDAGVYPAHAVELFLGEPSDLVGYGFAAETGVDAHAAALLRYPALGDRGPATAGLLTSLEANLPSRLNIYGTLGRIMFDDFYLRPERVVVQRDGAEPEELITQWPGGGYTFEAQEAMRCVRAGLTESPLVPWASTLSVARILDRWLAAALPTLAAGGAA